MRSRLMLDVGLIGSYVCFNGIAEGRNARKGVFDTLTHPDRPAMRTLALLGGIAALIGLLITTAREPYLK